MMGQLLANVLQLLGSIYGVIGEVFGVIAELLQPPKPVPVRVRKSYVPNRENKR